MKYFKFVSLVNGLLLSSNIAAAIHTQSAPLLKTTPQHHKATFSTTLPVISEGLSQEGKDIIASAVNHTPYFRATIMNINYVPVSDTNRADYGIRAVRSIHQLLIEVYPNKVPTALQPFIQEAPMIGVRDQGTLAIA